MPGILELPGSDIEALQGGDGGAFRDLLKVLLRSHCLVLGASESIVAADHRNVVDGGIDAEIPQGFPLDPFQYCCAKSCWQFKAQPKGAVTASSIVAEAEKPYARKLIGQGYAYRLCIADNLTPQDLDARIGPLSDAVFAINQHAPPPLILGATKIAEWASRYPSVVHSLRCCSPMRCLEQWKPTATQSTPVYVRIPYWDSVESLLRQHVDFSNDCPTPVLRVRGEAGVGKTRFVYELLSSIAGMAGLCLYTDDEQVGYNFAAALAVSRAHAVLILDECMPDTQERLRRLLNGRQRQIRVVSIDNSTRRGVGATPEPILERMSTDQVAQILRLNFPHLASSDLRAAIALSGGYIKIAADFCYHGLDTGFQRTEQYFDFRFSAPDHQHAIAALSLVERIGWRDEVADEIAELGVLVGIPGDLLRDRARRVKDDTGFVTAGGRYFYVTPDAFAKIGFCRAWAKWAEPDAQKFLSRISNNLLERFSRRVRDFGTPEIRRAFARSFGAEIADLVPLDLADKKKVERAVALVEANPEHLLAQFAAAIRRSSREDLLNNRGAWGDGWGPRRSIVWLCEHLSAFPEFFSDVEEILFRLANAETEPGLGNSASGIWKQLYQPFLSGTAVPMMQRMAILSGRLAQAAPHNIDLIADALGALFDYRYGRTEGPALVAGRIPPGDWAPQNSSEQREYLECALQLMRTATENPPSRFADRIFALVLANTRLILASGFQAWMESFVNDNGWFRGRLAAFLEQVDDFLRFEGPEMHGFDQRYLDEVRRWRTAMSPTDFLSRLNVALDTVSWRGDGLGEEHQRSAEISELAAEAFASSELLKQVFDYLKKQDAPGALEFWEQIGLLDGGFTLFPLLRVSLRVCCFPALRGYLHAICSMYPAHRAAVNGFIDELEETDPDQAVQMVTAIPDHANAIERILRLFDKGKIKAQMLPALRSTFYEHFLTESDAVALVERIIAVARDEASAADAGLMLVASWLRGNSHSENPPAPHGPHLTRVIKSLIDVANPEATMPVHYWGRLLDWVSKEEPEFAISKGLDSLTHSGYRSDVGMRLILSCATARPAFLMDRLGDQLLSGSSGPLLAVRGVGGILEALPESVVVSWVERTGVDAAKAIASSLPRPYLSDEGAPVVPSVTESILKLFGSDDRVSRRFVAGSGFRTYSGDIAAQHDKEAAVAALFLSHPLPAIRRWALNSKLQAEHNAAEVRRESEEDI